jgi:hypothetical protein
LPKVEPGRSFFRYLPHPLILILIVLVLVPLVLPFGSREEVKKIEKSRKKHDDEDDWGKTRELPDRPGIVRSSSWSPSILLMTNKSRTKGRSGRRTSTS